MYLHILKYQQLYFVQKLIAIRISYNAELTIHINWGNVVISNKMGRPSPSYRNLPFKHILKVPFFFSPKLFLHLYFLTVIQFIQGFLQNFGGLTPPSRFRCWNCLEDDGFLNSISSNSFGISKIPVGVSWGKHSTSKAGSFPDLILGRLRYGFISLSLIWPHFFACIRLAPMENRPLCWGNGERGSDWRGMACSFEISVFSTSMPWSDESWDGVRGPSLVSAVVEHVSARETLLTEAPNPVRPCHLMDLVLGHPLRNNMSWIPTGGSIPSLTRHPSVELRRKRSGRRCFSCLKNLLIDLRDLSSNRSAGDSASA